MDGDEGSQIEEHELKVEEIGANPGRDLGDALAPGQVFAMFIFDWEAHKAIVPQLRFKLQK